MKVTVHAFLMYTKNSFDKEPRYTFEGMDWTKLGPEHVLVREQDIEVDIPDDFDPRPKQIDALKAKKTEILAKAEVQAGNIEEQIQALLAIEYKPEART